LTKISLGNIIFPNYNHYTNRINIEGYLANFTNEIKLAKETLNVDDYHKTAPSFAWSCFMIY